MLCLVSAQTNHYDMSEGIKRYYLDPCHSIGCACLGMDFVNIGIETILSDTTINNNTYQKVRWEWQYILLDIDTFVTEIDYFRFDQGRLYKYSNSNDEIVQDYTFSKGDTLLKFFNHSEWQTGNPPEVILYDTLATFYDGSIHKVLWGDNDSIFIVNHGYLNERLPTVKGFVDTILIIYEDSWVLPTGSTEYYSPAHPFYYIDSIGVVYSEWNHRHMALVGISYPDGRLYGKKVNFVTSTGHRNIPLNFSLKQNYPNPFNASTKIKFSLPKPESVKIEVYNITGQKIVNLLNKPMPAGYHEVEFNGQNLSSGVYLYRIEAGTWTDTRKMLLVK
jgi:hypothetical protein